MQQRELRKKSFILLASAQAVVQLCKNIGTARKVDLSEENVNVGY